jgi:hypothetical protein
MSYHPSKESCRLSLIKKLRKLSPMLQSGSKLPRVGATRKKKKSYVKSEVLIAVNIKSIIFWDVTPCSLLEVYRRFRGTYYLHLRNNKTVSSLMFEYFLTD